MPSFMHTDTRSFYPVSPHVITPATGTVQPLWSGQNMISGPGTLAALTVNMPAPAYSGQTVTIVPTVAVTALTMKDAVGNAVAGAPTALVANTQVRMLWAGGAWTKQS